MADVALALTTLPVTPSPGVTVDPVAATPGAPDPFAALLSALAVPAPVPAVAAPTATPTPVMMPVALVAGDAAPTDAPVKASDDSDTLAATPDDVLTNAIDQGLTAILALVQPAPPPAPIAVVATASQAAVRTAPVAPPTEAPAPQQAETAPAADQPTPTPAATPATAIARFDPAVAQAIRTVMATAQPATTPVPAEAAAPTETLPVTADASASIPAAAPDMARPAAAPAGAARQIGLSARVEATSAQPRPARAETRRTGDSADPAASLPFAFAGPTAAQPAADPTAAAAPAPTDAAVQRQLDIAQDGQWLDSLARDIAMTAGQDGDLHFKLNPAHLGSLTVQIAQAADGASIRLTADNDQARTILVDAQPRLIAEARAQGLKVADTHVDLNRQHEGANGSSSMRQGDAHAGQNGQNRPPLPDHKPFSRSTGSNPERADSDDESALLYA